MEASYNHVLYIIMMSVFVLYLLGIYLKYGILSSISTSYYHLPPRFNWLFMAFTWGYGIPALMMSDTALMFFSGGIILFVGIASAFRNNPFTLFIHSKSAFAAIALSQLSIIIDYHMWYLSALFVAGAAVLYVGRSKIANWMYWLEVLAFICIAIVFGIKAWG